MPTHRIRSFFQSPLRRISILYGPGIEDTFISEDLQELSFEQSLLSTLKENGVRRVVFTAPHKPFFFLDDESRQLTFRESDPGLNQGATDPTSEMVFLNGGPLQRRLLIHPGASTAPSGGMGDAHAIRTLDALMRDAQTPTALVFLQAESLIRHFQDIRILSGIIGEWARLPRANPNRALFCFSADRYNDLLTISQSLPVPELRTFIGRNPQHLDDDRCVFHVGYPDSQEILNLLASYAHYDGLQIVNSDLPRLAAWMSAEGVLVNEWAQKLNHLAYLNLEIAVKRGWFSATRNTNQTLEEQFEQLTGLKQVKEKIFELAAWLNLEQQRSQTSRIHSAPPNLHMIFYGNPGTGKTTVARMFGEILHELGYLRRGHLVEVTARDLIADHVGGTALKTHAAVDRALDGVLFIDEAYVLTDNESGSFGQEALDALLTRMEDERGKLVVIAAGYPEKMRNFRRANPGLSRRFPAENMLYFEDFSPDELWLILERFLKSRRLRPDEPTMRALKQILQAMWEKRDASFGNAGEMRNLAESLDRRRAMRLANKAAHAGRSERQAPLILEDIPEHYHRFLPPEIPPVEQALGELDRLVGLEPVKLFLADLINRIQLERLRKDQLPDYSTGSALRHLVFMGNPGTGKTTVARLVGKIYRSLGLLTSGHCIEVSRADLVAGYVGQTAIKTMKCVERALDGVLFVDEAYSLLSGGENDFGKEAVDTLVKAIEDYKNRLVVILAGYSKEMNRLIQSNPGLRSRFAAPLTFPDLSGDQMAELLTSLAEKEMYTLPEPVKRLAVESLLSRRQALPETFGNAREVLDLFDQMKTSLARRVMLAMRQGKEPVLPSQWIAFIEEDVPDPLYPVQLPSFAISWKDSNFAQPPGLARTPTSAPLAFPTPPEEFRAAGDTIPSAPGDPDDPPSPPVLEKSRWPGSNKG
ncbi:MAG: AAA family ATPase [Anaerolineae bacterium]|nr:AAA family ATPase [Anaerolineae bacterium]